MQNSFRFRDVDKQDFWATLSVAKFAGLFLHRSIAKLSEPPRRVRVYNKTVKY